jgi:hypothetical protein
VVGFVPRSLCTRGGAPGARGVEGWVGHGAGLDAVVGGRFPAPAGTRTPGRPACGPALCH